jgi:hypothetical protein
MSSPISANIPLKTLFLKTFSPYSFHNVRDLVSYPYKTIEKIRVSYILIFCGIWEDKEILN